MQLLDDLLARVDDAARSVGEERARAVDANARFPSEMFDVLGSMGILSSPLTPELGGSSLGLQAMARLCAVVSAHCGSSGLILAMHFVQLACVLRHQEGGYIGQFLRRFASQPHLIASATSEIGTFGDITRSVCSIEGIGERIMLTKRASTVSYGAHADSILVTARSSREARPNEQSLVLFEAGQFALSEFSDWDTMGMRGTCSSGATVRAEGHSDQILKHPFHRILSQTMAPYSHVLWAAVWWGICSDAVKRANKLVRAKATSTPSSRAAESQMSDIARLRTALAAFKDNWATVAQHVDSVSDAGGRQALEGIDWVIRVNALKIFASEIAPKIVHGALQALGVAGYRNDSAESVTRHYRDVLSASLMISNARLLEATGQLCLVSR